MLCRYSVGVGIIMCYVGIMRCRYRYNYVLCRYSEV